VDRPPFRPRPLLRLRRYRIRQRIHCHSFHLLPRRNEPAVTSFRPSTFGTCPARNSTQSDSHGNVHKTDPGVPRNSEINTWSDCLIPGIHPCKIIQILRLLPVGPLVVGRKTTAVWLRCLDSSHGQSKRPSFRHSAMSMPLHIGVVHDETTVHVNQPDEASGDGNVRSSSRHSSTVSAISISNEDDDASTSYETARNNIGMQPPLAPRHGDSISFDFVTTEDGRQQDGGEGTGEVYMVTSCRESTTSLSTAGGGGAGEDNAESRAPTNAISTVSSISSDSTSTTTLTQLQPHGRFLHQMHMPLAARCEPPIFQSSTHWTEFHLLFSPMEDLTKAHVQVRPSSSRPCVGWPACFHFSNGGVPL
jgi:hypothetical protein